MAILQSTTLLKHFGMFPVPMYPPYPKYYDKEISRNWKNSLLRRGVTRKLPTGQSTAELWRRRLCSLFSATKSINDLILLD